MKWYRFTMAFDGEPQGVGFLHGLSEVGLPNKVLDALNAPFDANLKVPPIRDDKPVECWFTEVGMRVFAQDIEKILQAILPYNWQLLCGVLDSAAYGGTIDLEHDFLYQDEYQICWPRQVLPSAEFHEIASIFDVYHEEA